MRRRRLRAIRWLPHGAIVVGERLLEQRLLGRQGGQEGVQTCEERKQLKALDKHLERYRVAERKEAHHQCGVSRVGPDIKCVRHGRGPVLKQR